MADNQVQPRLAAPAVPVATSTAGDGFQQAMLKTSLETIPQLTEENYSIWKDKMTALLKLGGVLKALKNLTTAVGESEDVELVMLLLSKMESVTHNNVVTADNRDSAQKIWLSIKERFASSQSSNRARMFNDFLYVKFQEDSLQAFFTNIKVAIKKMVDIMHSDKDLDVEFVCNHLIQLNNKAKAESSKSNGNATEAALFSSKGKSNKSQGASEQVDSQILQSGVETATTILNKMRITLATTVGTFNPTLPRTGGKNPKLNGKPQKRRRKKKAISYPY
ncbi:hypothetical protein VP01_1229g4 [Puccinia sorghi]|uniref:DUF4219 domain-containing protein n=1 Tax=Puccinia sorghi TaxID=27349 RepID=A0A0L6VPU0_9BASI|nr:hypothetical protein VP01_1229g4 [Puccinia sorghi]